MISQQLEAMKLALEALFTYEDDWVEDGMGGVHHNVVYDEKKIFKAITALHQAIEQCTYPNCDYPCMNLPDCKESLAQPSSKHEPLGFMNAGHAYELQRKRITYGYVYSKKQKGASIPLYTSPPQRQPLTDEEINTIVDANTTDDHGYDIWCNGHGVARAIEAAHGIKEK